MVLIELRYPSNEEAVDTCVGRISLSVGRSRQTSRVIVRAIFALLCDIPEVKVSGEGQVSRQDTATSAARAAVGGSEVEILGRFTASFALAADLIDTFLV